MAEREEELPELLGGEGPHGCIVRVWQPGCSPGTGRTPACQSRRLCLRRRIQRARDSALCLQPHPAQSPPNE